MAGERSLYNKITIVLDIAKSVEVTAIGQLANNILARKLPPFLSDRYNKETDQFEKDIPSLPLVKRTLNFCRVLGLMADDGSLTTTGREATRRTRFDAVIAGAVRSFLQAHGIKLAALNDVIKKRLQANPPVLPTSEELWLAGGNTISRGMFARMLTLLAHSGAAHSAQRRIYLKFDIR